MEGPVGVRKGAWSREEDTLLQKCILNFGEGNWHLVPERAGLNRCRKSCRLRWLNYLSPYIKRGELNPDEIDLLIRLHKLLGNRWSLIAGRLPGRTANDLKNYWNTHFKKKKKKPEEEAVLHHDISKRAETSQLSRTIKPIKPKPRALSANWTVVGTSSSITGAGAGDQNMAVQERERPPLVITHDQAACGEDSSSSPAVPPSYPLEDLLLPAEKFELDVTFDDVEGKHHFQASDFLFSEDPWFKLLHLE